MSDLSIRYQGIPRTHPPASLDEKILDDARQLCPPRKQRWRGGKTGWMSAMATACLVGLVVVVVKPGMKQIESYDVDAMMESEIGMHSLTAPAITAESTSKLSGEFSGEFSGKLSDMAESTPRLSVRGIAPSSAKTGSQTEPRAEFLETPGASSLVSELEVSSAPMVVEEGTSNRLKQKHPPTAAATVLVREPSTAILSGNIEAKTHNDLATDHSMASTPQSPLQSPRRPSLAESAGHSASKSPQALPDESALSIELGRIQSLLDAGRTNEAREVWLALKQRCPGCVIPVEVQRLLNIPTDE